MAVIKPFQAIRPADSYASKIAALPYDVYHREEAKKIVEENPLSFLSIDRGETSFPLEQDMYAPCVYEAAASRLKEWEEKGYFIREDQKAYYLYELTREGKTQTGFVAVSSIDDYVNEVILKHELTREEKEQDRINHISYLNAQTGPIFLAFRDRKRLSAIMEEVKETLPVYDVTADDGVRHRIFTIFDQELIDEIEKEFEQVDHLYIADGHHRCASAVKVGLNKRKAAGEIEDNASYNYFLSVIFPQSELTILDYNRVVKDLAGLSKEEYLERLRQSFMVEKCKEAVSPQKKGEFGMFMEDGWYRLTFTGNHSAGEDIVKDLDVSILQDYCLNPILNIEDPRTDHRIDFVGGIRGLQELEKRVKEGEAVAFSMYPTTMEELFLVAEAGKLMPPKSTWFEPKLRSGFFIHEI